MANEISFKITKVDQERRTFTVTYTYGAMSMDVSMSFPGLQGAELLAFLGRCAPRSELLALAHAMPNEAELLPIQGTTDLAFPLPKGVEHTKEESAPLP